MTDVVEAHRGRVVSLVRRLVPWAKHREEGEQVGEFGLLLALEKYAPEQAWLDEGGIFWFFAYNVVRGEIQRWLDEAILFRPRSHDRRYYDVRARVEELHEESLETEQTSVEEQASDIELKKRLDDFVATLTAKEKKLLLCEKRSANGRGVELGNNARARGYLSLVERATAFVRGDEWDGTSSGEYPTRSKSSMPSSSKRAG